PILRKAIQSTIVEHVARSFESRPQEPQSAPPEKPAKVEPEPLPDTGSARAGIVTTDDEVETMRLVESWVHEVIPGAPVTFRDSKSYFAIHQDNVRKWFLRGNLDKTPGWIALRHVAVEDGRRLAPGVEVVDAGFPGGCRFTVGENF